MKKTWLEYEANRGSGSAVGSGGPGSGLGGGGGGVCGGSDAEGHSSSGSSSDAILKHQQDALLRRIDNERQRQSLKSQLSSEILLKNEIRNTQRFHKTNSWNSRDRGMKMWRCCAQQTNNSC
jgi:hypothetical protein